MKDKEAQELIEKLKAAREMYKLAARKDELLMDEFVNSGRLTPRAEEGRRRMNRAWQEMMAAEELCRRHGVEPLTVPV